jgi:hypothetical protein
MKTMIHKKIIIVKRNNVHLKKQIKLNMTKKIVVKKYILNKNYNLKLILINYKL